MFYRKSWNRVSLKITFVLLLCALLLGCASVSSGLRNYDSDDDSDAPYEPTLSYQMLIMGVKMGGYKKYYAGDPDTVIMRARRFNNRVRQLPPNSFYRRFIVTETTVHDRPYFLITPKKNVQTDRVVIFLYGGGFMKGIDSYHWKTIEYILNELAIPIYVPLYHIYPEMNPYVPISFINEVFLQAYEAYPSVP